MSEVQTSLGRLIEVENPQRDAIHIAVAPVIAQQRLTPGEHIGFMKHNDTSTVGRTSQPVGIVDPFLKDDVREGGRFWMFLYPNTITSLKHVWTHPAFGEEARVEARPDQKAASEAWIRQLADHVDVTYNQIMDHARQQAHGSDFPYLIGGSAMEGEQTPEEFWEHYENVTGERVPTDRRENFFSCSC